jgi:hypothetical protein
VRATAELHSTALDRHFFVGCASVIALVVVAGFAPTFFARGWFGEPRPLSSLVVVHGALGSSWLAAFVAQSLLASRRLDWHVRIGVFGVALAAAFVATGAFVVRALEGAHSFDTPRVLAAHVFTNVAPLAAFGVLVACGIWQRHASARHKRLMLLAAVVLVPPGVGRLLAQFGFESLGFPIYVCFAFAPVLYDAVRRVAPDPAVAAAAIALVAIDVTTTTWLTAVGS